MKDLIKLVLTAILIVCIPAIVGISLVTLSDKFPAHQNIFNNLLVLSIPSFIIIVSWGFSIFIFIRLKRSFKDTPVSFLLHPFRNTSNWINLVYPSEKFISKKLCFEQYVGLSRVKKFPMGFSLQIIPSIIPAYLIETDASFYVDRRLQKLLSTLTGTIIAFIFFTFLSHFFGKDIQDIVMPLVFFALIVLGVNNLFSVLFLQPNCIEILRKSWITNEERKGNKLKISLHVATNTQVVLNPDKFLFPGRINFDFKQVFYLI